jgi:glycosyltransferase involved in cell wall biosynthesis
MVKPIHVAHVIGSTGLYGAERWILAQLRYLDQQEVRTTVLNLVDQPGETSEIVSEADKQGCFALDFYTGGRFNILGVSRLARWARRSGCSILHSHGYKSDMMALAAGRLAGVKVVGTPHGWSEERDRKLLLYEKIDRIFLRFFDHVCPLSSGLYSGLVAAGINRSRMTLIPNGVDIREIDDARPKTKGDGKRKIGYIGQFIERKRLEDLVEAFYLLDRSDCELFLIGEGPSRKKICREIESTNDNRVHCPGYSSHRLEDLKSFDVFVLPSVEEGIPRCIMEALAARIPVVGTDIEGIRHLIIDEQTGFLVPARRPHELARAIGRILDSPELAMRLAATGRSLVEKQFSAKQMAERYQAFYLSVLSPN